MSNQLPIEAKTGSAPETPLDEERKSIPLGFFGRTPPFTKRQRRVFLIATTAGFFDQYDRALLTLALKQIQKGLQITEQALGESADADPPRLHRVAPCNAAGRRLRTPPAAALHDRRLHAFHRTRGNLAHRALLRRV